MSRPTTWARPLAIAVLVLTLAACSGTDSAGPSPSAGVRPGQGASSATSGTSSPTMSSADELTDQILASADNRAPVASVQGNLDVAGRKVPVVAEILEVRAGSASTLLRWRLRSASGKQVDARGYSLSAKPPLFDTRAVALTDTAGKRVLTPFTYVPQVGENDTKCVCARTPTSSITGRFTGASP